ncbi:unnamed protein product [Phaedon cochleariae]|uniref:LysM domain-containing protein n=1 Tax=Phaedon cochleariae TaxID=80249 RepID=A0A9P0DQA5_PHACE|nr:unnamed protein product [Phaedon cochleariae]
MDRGAYEKLSIRESASSLKKYGSTSKHLTRNENYIKHFVSNADTLQGISLKYNVTIEQIRRANKLWASDSLFLKEFLLIPSTEKTEPSKNEKPGTTSEVMSPTTSSFDDDNDNIDDYLSKIDAAIASTKEDIRKTTKKSEFAVNSDFTGDRRQPAISRMKQKVNNNISTDHHLPHTVVVQQGKKIRTSLHLHEQQQEELFEL